MVCHSPLEFEAREVDQTVLSFVRFAGRRYERFSAVCVTGRDLHAHRLSSLMCGIAGKIYLDGQRPIDPHLIQRMTDVIAHRGPDGEGKYVCGCVGLGHRRLVDYRSEQHGTQPMCNEDETVWIVFNGEIYNFPELRDQLIKRGHSFAPRLTLR